MATFSSIFAATATVDELKALRAAYDRWVKAGEGLQLDGFPMAKFCEASGLKYSRARQIARRWFIEEQAQHLLIDTAGLVKGFEQAHEGWMPEQGESLRGEALASTIRSLHDAGQSWGDISGRMGITEAEARKLFEYKSRMRAKGQRVGQGGAFLNADPTLYLENRKAEGAWVPSNHKGPIRPEILINFKKPKVVRVRKPKAVKVEAPAVVLEEAVA